jgi:hypothetical protein
MWKRLRQQQQRGAQFEGRQGKVRQQGEAPAEAVAGREAQDHDYADLDTGGEPRSDIDYPADDVPDRKGDITPSRPEPHVDWDDVVQPEGRRDDDPLPEGK